MWLLKWEAFESERQSLDAFEKTLSQKEDDIDIELGGLEKKKKDFEFYKQSEISKYKEAVDA